MHIRKLFNRGNLNYFLNLMSLKSESMDIKKVKSACKECRLEDISSNLANIGKDISSPYSILFHSTSSQSFKEVKSINFKPFNEK